jgi:hypothetical protein
LKIQEDHVASINLHDFVKIKIFDISNIKDALKDCNIFLNIPISLRLYDILLFSGKPSIFINSKLLQSEVVKPANIVKIYNDFDTCTEQSWKLFNPKIPMPEDML